MQPPIRRPFGLPASDGERGAGGGGGLGARPWSGKAAVGITGLSRATEPKTEQVPGGLHVRATAPTSTGLPVSLCLDSVPPR
eukprot:8539481-Lingulodinium_polyedra.AAC.1